MNEAYPLKFPIGWKRNKYPERARFGNQCRGFCIKSVINEIRMLGGTKIIISSNLELKDDGLPRSAQKRPDDEGVAVYFELNGNKQCFPCDRWNKIEHNLWAIAKCINALRNLERWGAKTMVNAAFTGFKALPNYTQSGINYFDGVTEEEIRNRYVELCKKFHPDVIGGSID